MSLVSRVSAYIKEQPGKHLCVMCIKLAMSGTNHRAIHDVARQLSKGGMVLGFERSEDTCDTCGKLRLVLYASSEPGTIAASA